MAVAIINSPHVITFNDRPLPALHSAHLGRFAEVRRMPALSNDGFNGGSKASRLELVRLYRPENVRYSLRQRQVTVLFSNKQRHNTLSEKKNVKCTDLILNFHPDNTNSIFGIDPGHNLLEKLHIYQLLFCVNQLILKTFIVFDKFQYS